MAGNTSVFYKEYAKLTKSVSRLSDGQVTIGCLEYDDINEHNFFFMDVTPDGGHYKNATCKFAVEVSGEYPENPPFVKCLTKVYHPNIDLLTENAECSVRGDYQYAPICVNLLDCDWSSAVGLDGAIMAVLFLFHEPNPDDSLNPLISSGELTEEEFGKMVRKACKGAEIDDIDFPRLYPDGFEIEDDDTGAEEGVMETTDQTNEKSGADNGILDEENDSNNAPASETTTETNTTTTTTTTTTDAIENINDTSTSNDSSSLVPQCDDGAKEEIGEDATTVPSVTTRLSMNTELEDSGCAREGKEKVFNFNCLSMFAKMLDSFKSRLSMGRRRAQYYDTNDDTNR